MNRIQDMGFLILFSFFSLLYCKPDYGFVLAFLLCLCFCSIGYVTESSRGHLAAGLILISFSLFLPRLCIFFPAVFYIFFMDHLYIPVSAGSILFLSPQIKTECFSLCGSFCLRLFPSACSAALKSLKIWNKTL